MLREAGNWIVKNGIWDKEASLASNLAWGGLMVAGLVTTGGVATGAVIGARMLGRAALRTTAGQALKTGAKSFGRGMTSLRGGLSKAWNKTTSPLKNSQTHVGKQWTNSSSLTNAPAGAATREVWSKPKVFAAAVTGLAVDGHLGGHAIGAAINIGQDITETIGSGLAKEGINVFDDFSEKFGNDLKLAKGIATTTNEDGTESYSLIDENGGEISALYSVTGEDGYEYLADKNGHISPYIIGVTEEGAPFLNSDGSDYFIGVDADGGFHIISSDLSAEEVIVFSDKEEFLAPRQAGSAADVESSAIEQRVEENEAERREVVQQRTAGAQETVEDIKDTADEAVSKVKAKGAGLAATAATATGAAAAGSAGLWDKLSEAWENSAFGQAMNGLTAIWDSAVDWLGDLFLRFIEPIFEKGGEILNNLGSKIKSLVFNTVKDGGGPAQTSQEVPMMAEALPGVKVDNSALFNPEAIPGTPSPIYGLPNNALGFNS
jgi:hypothetical protein